MPRTLLPAVLFGTASLTWAAGFTLSSPDIESGGFFSKRFDFNGFGCNGENKSPALRWSGEPAGTRSFAVTVYDPDAPSGSGWWHWMVFDIPPHAHELAAGAGTADGTRLPRGARQNRIDYGVAAFGGVCPPAGDKPHRYVFTVHALKTDKLDVPADATPALAGFTINANTLDKASFTARYGRSK